MTYILISFLLVMSCWLLLGQKYFVYVLACLPFLVFAQMGAYIYASVMAILMFLFINMGSIEPTSNKQNRFKALILAIAISTLPVASYFSSQKTNIAENIHNIFISIILGLLIVFVAASSSIGAGINRTKGDKTTYE